MNFLFRRKNMPEIKIILLGESGVGKTSLLSRYHTGEFLATTTITIGPQFKVKNLYLQGKEIAMFIWDTGGQERFRSVTKNYFRHGDGVLLVYDVTDPTSFSKLSSWLCELKDINENAEILIVGNKNEDPRKKSVVVSMVQNFAIEKNLDHMEVSAKSGENVNEAFQHLAMKILTAKGILTDESEDSDSENNNKKDKKRKKKKKGTDYNVKFLDFQSTEKEKKQPCC